MYSSRHTHFVSDSPFHGHKHDKRLSLRDYMTRERGKRRDNSEPRPSDLDLRTRSARVTVPIDVSVMPPADCRAELVYVSADDPFELEPRHDVLRLQDRLGIADDLLAHWDEGLDDLTDEAFLETI